MTDATVGDRDRNEAEQARVEMPADPCKRRKRPANSNDRPRPATWWLAHELNKRRQDIGLRTDLQTGLQRSSSLVDVLDRVLDKGLVVAGDIKVSLAEVELLTIQIRLILCSIDKAQEIGLDWWRYDQHLAPGSSRLAAENTELRKQIRVLERRLASASQKQLSARPRGTRARG